MLHNFSIFGINLIYVCKRPYFWGYPGVLIIGLSKFFPIIKGVGVLVFTYLVLKFCIFFFLLKTEFIFEYRPLAVVMSQLT